MTKRERDRVVRTLRRAGAGEKATQARRIALQGEIGRLVDAVAQVGLSSALRDRLAAAEAELAALQASARAPTSVPDAADHVELPPGLDVESR